jgi:hypothetical protein
MQRKIQRPVQFEITEQTRQAVTDWIRRAGLRPDEYLFPSRVRESPHLSTRQYARIADCWVREIGLDPAAYGTHTLRRTKASLIFSPSARIAAHGRSRPPRDEAVGRAGQGRSGRMMAMLDGDILTLLDAVTTQQRSASPTLTRGPVGAALYRPEARKRRQTSYHRPPREVRRCFALSS